MFKKDKSETNHKRVQLLLDYLARHEQRYEKAIHQAAGEQTGPPEAKKIRKIELRGL